VTGRGHGPVNYRVADKPMAIAGGSGPQPRRRPAMPPRDARRRQTADRAQPPPETGPGGREAPISPTIYGARREGRPVLRAAHHGGKVTQIAFGGYDVQPRGRSDFGEGALLDPAGKRLAWAIF
jgi:hypothetical protein